MSALTILENGSQKKGAHQLPRIGCHDLFAASSQARAPRALVTTEAFELRSFAKDLEIALNQIPKEIDLSDTFKRSGARSLLWPVRGEGRRWLRRARKSTAFPYAEPFVDLIQVDDYFCDMTAKNWKEIQFEGNDYWVSKDHVKKVFGGVDLDEDSETATGTTGTEKLRRALAFLP